MERDLTGPTRLGRWSVEAQLGAGAMGVVYLGVDGSESCALKVIRPDLANDPSFGARFRREVTAARRVSSPYVARVIEADPDGVPPWMASELVRGPSLEEHVRAHGVLEPHDLAELAVALADGIEAIHRAGVVHRDLKPSNVLLGADGPRIVDFGVAHTPMATALTATGLVIGSPSFMSPEQAMGLPVTGASDVFSLAGVIVFAASGRGPFGSGTSPDVLYRVVHEQARVPALPEPLYGLLHACLSKDPSARPPPTAFSAAIKSVLEPDATIPSLASSMPTMLSTAAVQPGVPRERTRRTGIASEVLFVGFAVAIVLVAVVVFLIAKHSPTPSHALSTTRPSTTITPGNSQTSPPSTTPTTAPVTSSVTLVDSGYGFDVPADWTTQPLADPQGSPVSIARFFDPAGQAALLYAISGGETGEVYNVDGTVNLQGALTEACGDSHVSASFTIGPNAVGYSCATAVPDTEVNGVVIVAPEQTPFTWKKLELTLPSSQHGLATEILNTFTLARTTCPCPKG